MLAHLLSARRRTAHRLKLELDLARFRRRHGRVVAGPPATAGPTALFVSASEFPYQLKLEGMLAKGLRAHGLTPVMVVPGARSIAIRYFQSFGIDRFVTLESRLPEGDDDAAAATLEALEQADWSVSSLKRLEYRGVGVGWQVLSTLSRTLHEGSVDLADLRVRSEVRRLVGEAIAWTRAAEGLLDEIDPKLVMFLERAYALYGPLFDLATQRDMNAVQFVSGYGDGSLVFKRYTRATRATHPRSLSDESWARVRAMSWDAAREAELEAEFARRYDERSSFFQTNQAWTRPQPAAEIAARLRLRPDKPTVVVFSHVLWDANMFYGDDLFPDQGQWFLETVRAACANDRVDWIVKLHPANVGKLRRDGVASTAGEAELIAAQLGELPTHVQLLEARTDIRTRDLFALTDVGVTIRGSVGIELPCFGTPVLTAGSGYYAGRGFTVDSASAEEYLARLARIEGVPPLGPEQRELARKHAYGIFVLRSTHFEGFETTFRRTPAGPEPHLVVRATSAQELLEADDLRRFAAWAVDSRAHDLLDERRLERDAAAHG